MNIVLKYSFLGFPLAFFGIPIYIFLPKFMHQYYGLELTFIGAILFFSRIFDAVFDPYLGHFSDKYNLTQKTFIISIAIFLSISFNLFFYLPNNINLEYQYLLFAVNSIISYILFSLIYINYYNLATSIKNISQNTISARRELMVFLGIIFASSSPFLMKNFISEEILIYRIYGFIFLLLILFGSIILPKTSKPLTLDRKQGSNVRFYLKKSESKNLLILFFINSIPVSITSNLLSFYLEYVLDLENQMGNFLIIYFIFAALGSVFFGILSRKFNRYNILLSAMILACFSFFFTVFISKSIAYYFYIICIFSGFALGLEMSVLPSIAGDIIKESKRNGNSFFGLWASLSKISLALSAGIFLPIIGKINSIFIFLDIESKMIILYAIIPLLIKILVIIYAFKINIKGDQNEKAQTI